MSTKRKGSSCYENAGMDEPIFVLRAQDRLAAVGSAGRGEKVSDWQPARIKDAHGVWELSDKEIRALENAVVSVRKIDEKYSRGKLMTGCVCVAVARYEPTNSSMLAMGDFQLCEHEILAD